MIRFIDLNGQDTGYAFAFWDTITDKFIQVGEDQAWDNLPDFRECAMIAKLDADLERRMTNLIPK